MNITYPTDIQSCTPDQLAKWVFLSSGELDLESLSAKLDFRVQVVSIFTGVSKEVLENYPPKDINTVFSHMIHVLSSHEPKDEPEGRIAIDGVQYVFDSDFAHMTTGQIVDLKLIEDVYSDPCAVLSIIYIEEGYKYNQVKEGTKNVILNKTSKRKKIFKEGFPGDEFLNVFAFFLSSYEKRKNAIYALKMAQAQMTMEKMKKELTQELSITVNGSNGQQT